MDKDYTTRLRNTAKYHLGGVLGNTLKEAAEEIERLQRYEKLVQYIASDYWELSHDKIKWLYTEYKTKSRKLIEEDNE